jgi:hypothetical protein
MKGYTPMIEFGEEESLSDIANILDEFDPEDIQELISDQISTDHPTMFHGDNINHFQPFYVKYQQFKVNPDVTEDQMTEITSRFYGICKLIIDAIFKEYELNLDDEWIDNNIARIPALTMALYDFFVIDLPSNIEEVIIGYIADNYTLIWDTFSELQHSKDVSEAKEKTGLSIEMCTLLVNIYTIMLWIVDQLTNVDYLELLDQDYVPLIIVKGLYDEGVVNGYFRDDIQRMLRENVDLRATVGFEIVSKITNNEIRDLYKPEVTSK